MADDNQNKTSEEQPAPLELKAGQSVGTGRYILKRFLGQGGMGIVWLAQDKNLGGEVALKFLPGQLRVDSSALDDLRQETLKSRKLTHPNIIRIHDLFELEGEDPFISMEYVDGPTLSKRRVQMPARIMEWESLADLVRQLCEALDYAHNEKVIHRDLKPANLMLDSRQRVKLADFGIARVVTDSLSRVTMRQGTSGTLVYMSPQQLDGRPSNPTDDIYSVGATLFELMTSKPPFWTGEIAHQIRYVEATSITQRLEELRIASRVPKVVEDAVTACLKKNPSDRPQSAHELSESLGLIESRPPSSKSVRHGAKPLPEPPPPRKGRTTAIVGGILAGLAVVTGVAYYLLYQRPGTPPPPVVTTGSLQVRIAPPAAVAAGATWQVDDRTPQASGAMVSGLSGGNHVVAFTDVPNWTSPAPQTVSVAANTTNTMVSGAYVQILGTLTVQPASNQPTKFGALEVTLIPSAAANAGATWQVDDGPSQLSGATTNLPLGQRITVSYHAFPPWVPMVPKVQVIVDQTTQITGIFSNTTPPPVVKPPSAAPFVQPNIPVVMQPALPQTPHPGQAWNNSLGMRFAPLPGTPKLLSIWDTRVSDYRRFATEANFTDNLKWKTAPYANVESNPAVFVSYDDAVRFCTWLTTYEQSKGQLNPGQRYRLPTDAEWSLAAGLTTEGKGTPKQLNEVVKGYPWGKDWPPPPGAGNFSGQEVTNNIEKILGYTDPYPQLAPVGSGSFHPINGYYDLAGNVWQYCADKFDPPNPEVVLRGGAWDSHDKFELLSSHRKALGTGYRERDVGFRCILDP